MINWTIHPVADDPDLPPMLAILPDDGTDGYIVGELDEMKTLYIAIGAYLDNGTAGCELDRLDERLGMRWLSVSEASAEWGIPISSITLACRQGDIRYAEKRGRDWRFPQATFLAWMSRRPGRGNLQG